MVTAEDAEQQRVFTDEAVPSFVFRPVNIDPEGGTRPYVRGITGSENTLHSFRSDTEEDFDFSSFTLS